MPIHSHPVLRNRELAQEAAGLIVKLNSDGYTAVVNAENAGLRPKNSPPPIVTFKFNGNSFDAKE